MTLVFQNPQNTLWVGLFSTPSQAAFPPGVKEGPGTPILIR